MRRKAPDLVVVMAEIAAANVNDVMSSNEHSHGLGFGTVLGAWCALYRVAGSHAEQDRLDDVWARWELFMDSVRSQR